MGFSQTQYVELLVERCPSGRFSSSFFVHRQSLQYSVWISDLGTKMKKLKIKPVLSIRLKVHKHEIILNFLLPKSNPYMPFVNFWRKKSLLFLRFSPEFRCSNISAVTEHTRNQIFLRYIQTNFFSKSSYRIIIY